MKDYKKILEGIVNIISNTEKSDAVSNICSYIDENCPELKESEDERIRKWLVGYFNQYATDGMKEFSNGLKVKDIIAWLEKQGNNKPKPDFRERYKKMTESEWFKKTYEDKSCGIDSVSVDEADETITIHDGYVATIRDNKVHIKREGKSALEAINELANNANKVEPRFHKGEWIVNSSGEVAHIAEVKNDRYGTLRYYLEWVNGRKSDPTPGFVDNDFHFWTIEDAKDGDVLSSYECYVVFKEIDGLNIKCYFTYHLNVGSIPTFCVNTLQNKTAFYPVSKEECKILFEKINEFGYKWDSENKKLIKI